VNPERWLKVVEGEQFNVLKEVVYTLPLKSTRNCSDCKFVMENSVEDVLLDA